MAESIIIHFRDTDEKELIACMNTHFDRPDNKFWYHPKNDYLVIITCFTDDLREYADEDKDLIREKLGGDPTTSFDFEIRRSRSDEACDLLEPFIRNKLKDFNFVVDDMENLYSRSDLRSATDFLDIYRYEKSAERSSADPRALRPRVS